MAVRGGALLWKGGDLIIKDSVFAHNSAVGDAGAILVGYQAKVRIKASELQGNKGGCGDHSQLFGLLCT